MIKAKLADGRVLEFPDGTKQEVIDRIVKQETIPGRVPVQPERAIAPIPEGGAAPISAIGGTAPMPTFGEGVVEEIPQVAGGMALGVAGAAAGVGFLPVVGLVGLGAGAGEAYKQIGQQLSGSLDAPKTSLDAVKRIGKAGVTEAGWELTGGLIAKGFGKIIAPFKSKVVKETEEVIGLLKDRIKPVVLLPAEATESRVLDLLQNISESSIVGGGSIQAYKTKRLKFFDDFADSLIDEFGKRTDPTDLGNLFVTSISESRKVHAKAASVLYNSVRAGRAKTEIRSLKNFAGPLQRRAAKLEGIEAKNAGDDLVTAVMDLPDQLSYKEATELRSRLISRIDEFSILNKKAPAIGKAKKMVGLLDKAIGKSLGEIGVPTSTVPAGPTPLEAWRTANRFYRDGQKKFNNTLLRRLVKLADDTGTGAEMIASAIFKPRHISSVQKVKIALKDDPATWRKMQGFFMQHLLQKSTDVDGNIMGKRILNVMSGKPNSFGMPMLKEVFTEPQIKSLTAFGKAVRLTQQRRAEGAGKVLIQLTQAGAMGALFTGNLELPAATIIIAPAIMSKMLLNPKIAKLLTAGLTLPAKSPEAAGIMTRLIAATWRAQEERGEEDETIE